MLGIGVSGGSMIEGRVGWLFCRIWVGLWYLLRRRGSYCRVCVYVYLYICVCV